MLESLRNRYGLHVHIGELLDFVDDMLDDLGSRREINYLRKLLEDPRGTGADRQVVVYQETGSIDALIRFLMQQTMQDIPIEVLSGPG
jgi:carboxylate-amine ligase